MKNKTSQLFGLKSGFSMNELMIYMAIVLFLMGGSYAIYRLLTDTSSTTIAQQAITVMRINIASMYQDQGNYNGLNNAIVIRSGAVPKNLIKGNALVSPFGGAITVTPGTDSSTFNIALSGLEQKPCASLAATQISDWLRVSVNGTTINKSTAVTQAANACSDSGNTITFVSR